MGENTKIEWCDHSWNPWRGCTKVAAGCANCYAEQLSKRNPATLGTWGDHGTRVVASESMWKSPLKWNEQAENRPTQIVKPGSIPVEYISVPRARVFCASLADVFEDWRGPITDSKGNVVCCPITGLQSDLQSARRRLFQLIDDTQKLDWLLLTKRPQNIRKMTPTRIYDFRGTDSVSLQKFRRNVWLGTSIACRADLQNIDHLRKCDDLAPVRFLSIEPLLEDLGKLTLDGINWVIVGGESGPNARPMHPDCVRSIRDQCQAAGVPFFFKQWGEWHTHSTLDGLPHFRAFQTYTNWVNKASTWVRGGICLDARGRDCKRGADFMRARDEFAFPVTIMDRVGKAKAGRLLDGREWNEFPTVS